MRRAWWAIALGSVVTIGGLLGPGAGPALAQGALGAAGTGGPRVTPGWRVPASPTLVRRYYSYDPRTRRYYCYEVPVGGYTYLSPYPYAARARRAGPGIFNGPRRAAGIGAQGTDGRTNPEEWIDP